MSVNRKENLYSRMRLDDGYVREGCSDRTVEGFRGFRSFNWEMGSNVVEKREKSGSVVDDVADLYSRVRLDDGYVREGCSDKNVEGIRGFRTFNWEMGNSVVDKREKSGGVVDDVADLLPKDPFDMNMSATVSAFSGLLDDLERDLGLNSIDFVDSDEDEVKKVDNQIFAGLNIILNCPVRIRPECDDESELEEGLDDGHVLFDGGFEEIILGYEKYLIPTDAACQDESCSGEDINDSVDDGGCPPDALNYALTYLSVEDLFSVERVCKSLRDSVRNDPLLWRNIHIDHPLSRKITDDALVKLTDRAQGRLQSLSLLKCLNITNNSLKRVLENNPSLRKLSVPGCVKLKIDDFLWNLRVFKSTNPPGITRLRVAEFNSLQDEHFVELKNLLGTEDNMQPCSHKPRFYRSGEMHLSLDDPRAIDLEKCPICTSPREVYDCPAVSCIEKQNTTPPCRACASCIPRCVRCGRCLRGRDYDENFVFLLHCLDNDKCCLHEQASCLFYIYG